MITKVNVEIKTKNRLTFVSLNISLATMKVSDFVLKLFDLILCRSKQLSVAAEIAVWNTLIRVDTCMTWTVYQNI